MDKFIFPEKWCVLTTPDTRKIVNTYINSKGYNSELKDDYYIHYPFYKGGFGSAYNEILEHYTQISFDQFEKYILKKPEENYSYLIQLLNNINIK